MKDQYAFTAFWPGKLLMAVLVTLVVTMAVLFGQSGQAWAYPAVTVLVNGSKVAMDVLPIIEDGRTLVPVRAVGEALGASVEWNQKTRKVTVKNSQDTIVLTIDSNAATVSGLPKPLDVPARIVAGRTVIPLRFVSENFGARVTWDQASYTVTIDTANQTAPPEEAVVKLESELLTLLNQQRAKLNYKPMILLAPLTEMARGQAADMAKNGNFSHNSATYGDIHQRSQGYGLPPCCEFLAYGYPFADKILGSWLEGDNGAVLL
ncbi:MAG: stalk domain-containing protein, partial [Clostridiales bacterium]